MSIRVLETGPTRNPSLPVSHPDPVWPSTGIAGLHHAPVVVVPAPAVVMIHQENKIHPPEVHSLEETLEELLLLDEEGK